MTLTQSQADNVDTFSVNSVDTCLAVNYGAFSTDSHETCKHQANIIDTFQLTVLTHSQVNNLWPILSLTVLTHSLSAAWSILCQQLCSQWDSKAILNPEVDVHEAVKPIILSNSQGNSLNIFVCQNKLMSWASSLYCLWSFVYSNTKCLYVVELMEKCRTPPRCRSPSMPRKSNEPSKSWYLMIMVNVDYTILVYMSLFFPHVC